MMRIILAILLLSYASCGAFVALSNDLYYAPVTTISRGFNNTPHFSLASKSFDLNGRIERTNLYQFELEVPNNTYSNIGVIGRWESGDAWLSYEDLHQNAPYLNAGLGLFVRMFYDILSTGLSVHARLEGMGGPFIMLASGLSFGIAGYLGLDYKVHPWFSLTASLGLGEALGKETLISNVAAKDELGTGSLTYRRGTRTALIGVKSTYF